MKNMCGRAYHTYTDEELMMRYLRDRSRRNPLAGLKPNFNLSPTQLAPIVRLVDDGRQLDLFRWGLIPSWAKDVKSASRYSLINARSEEIAGKRSYAQAYRKRRCIVPLSGFIEWKREGKTKKPYAISLRDEPIMSMAGVWEEWTSKETGEMIGSFSVLTTSSNGFMSRIHDRMPVILSPKDEEAWLDPAVQEPEKLERFLKPCPDNWLSAYEVSTDINSPRNNHADLLTPVATPDTRSSD